MAEFVSEFLLEVWQIEQTCLFKLSWGQGYSLDACIPYPVNLPQVYQDWSTTYQSYYRHKRASAGLKATVSSTTNWETRLNYTEQLLITQFRDWLREIRLFEIRKVLTDASKATDQGNTLINLLIQCKDDMDSVVVKKGIFSLEKLPWEQLGSELTEQIPIHILRTTSKRPVPNKPTTRCHLRILAILGDDTGLDFQAERDAIEQKLKPIAHVQFEGWNITLKSSEINFKTQLRDAIADPRGWDILFFAGHSHDNWGGELMLTPDSSALIDEFADALKIARNRGLQFALFNSCLGCAIAEKLISYGLGYVVVMREPISNSVAQLFFQEFTEQLSHYVDVQTATFRACEMLFHRAKEHYEYPSAFLVPSIYTYGGVAPLTPPVLNCRVMLSRLKPTGREALVLLVLVFLSSQTAIQYPMMDWRQYGQAVYRDFGMMVMPTKALPEPPMLLVKVDDASLNAAKIESKDPIDRTYIAQLVKKTIELKVPIVGIDYVLKDYRKEQKILQDTLKQPQNSRFVFGTSERWGTAHEELINPNDRIDGDIDFSDEFKINGRDRSLNFFARTIGDSSILPAYPFSHQILCIAQQQTKNCNLSDSRAYYNPITKLSAWIGQQWLNPWVDYSIPFSQVYKMQLAKDFLQRKEKTPDIVMLIPSEEKDFDACPIPMAILSQITTKPLPSSISGGEIHAYQLYNLLHQGLIIPIPDAWAIGIVGIFSKLLLIWIEGLPRTQSISKWGWLMLLVVLPLVAYAVIFQVYVGIGLMLPVVFPTLVYLSYLFPQWLGQRFKQLIRRKTTRTSSILF